MNVEIYQGTSKQGKPFKAIKLTIGEWSRLVFPASNIEWAYLEPFFNEGKK